MTSKNSTSQRLTPKSLTAAISAICAGIPVSQAQEAVQEGKQDYDDSLMLEEVLVTATKRGDTQPARRADEYYGIYRL